MHGNVLERVCLQTDRLATRAGTVVAVGDRGLGGAWTGDGAGMGSGIGGSPRRNCARLPPRKVIGSIADPVHGFLAARMGGTNEAASQGSIAGRFFPQTGESAGR